MDFSPDDLPLLGETPSIELANTRYGQDDWALDFLEDEVLPLWLAHSPNATTQKALGRSGVTSLRSLRDSLFDLFDAAVVGRVPAESSLRAIDQHHGACKPASLVWKDDRPALQTRWTGSLRAQYLAAFARDAREVATGARWSAIRRCAAPDCTMLFLQQHRRRRFCYPGCSQRVRQAAYYLRKRETQ